MKKQVKRLQIETNSQQMLIFMSGAYAAAASAGSENTCEALSRLRNSSSPAFCCERGSQFNRRRQEGILGDSSRRAVEEWLVGESRIESGDRHL